VEAAAVKLKPVVDAFARSPATSDLAQRLPARGETLRLGGLAGSSGSVLAAWLANNNPHRQVVVVATTPGEAERWLTDLALLTDGAVALYPQREALGEEEPHYEIAGERVETLEALLRGQVRIVITTARATAERTLVPAALERLRLRLAPGDRQAPARAA
jgi:transcription-repair coupling factor (superfamily II helicase)